MAKKLIVLDPGHGGRDPGAIGNGLEEKNITLSLARRVMIKLASYNLTVKLTRDDDIYLPLEARANFANNLDADYFLSIHVNAGGGTGFESFIYNGAVSELTPGFRSTLHHNIMDYLRDYGVVNRGEKSANFAVLRETNMPAALIENLFIDTAKDAALLKDAEFLEGLAEAIKEGIVQSLSLQPTPAPSPTPTPKPIPEPTPQPTPTPTSPIWDPQQEITKLKQAGIIANDHPADAPVTWGEFATVINRLLPDIKN